MKHAPRLAVLLAIPLSIAALPGTAAVHVMPIKAFLCDSAEHAIQFADVMAEKESEEIAKYRVGRMASADACGRYVGMAVIESEHVELQGGVAYKLTAYRFREDNRTAWLAERTFAPPSSHWDL